MSRRDTILVAIMINCGLLLILFVTAMTDTVRTDHEWEKQARSEQLVQKETELKKQDSTQTVLAKKEPIHDVLQEVVTNKSPAIQIVKEIPNKETERLEKAGLLRKKNQEEDLELTSRFLIKQKDEEDLQNEEDEPDFVLITVKPGDFLSGIAQDNACTVEEIMTRNNLKTTQLKIGQKLQVPLPSKVELAKNEPAKQESTEEEYYIVKSGDNPWLIAMKHRIPLDALLRLNQLDEEKARRLNPGDKLRIR